MLDLSPVKLLIILIVAVLLVGPTKLPQVARQIGAAWRKFNEFRVRIDREVRESMPDLPSSQDLARYARSPVALLNQLASFDTEPLVADPGAEPAPDTAEFPSDPGAPGAETADLVTNGVAAPAPATNGHRAAPVIGVSDGSPPDGDPGMN
jgi:TatA/E family protein of Tat protein translocase